MKRNNTITEYKRGQKIRFKGQEDHVSARFLKMYDTEHGICEIRLWSGARLIGDTTKSLNEIELIE